MAGSNVTKVIAQAKVKRHQKCLTDAVLRLLTQDFYLKCLPIMGNRHHD
jgi:hypothetical protein